MNSPPRILLAITITTCSLRQLNGQMAQTCFLSQEVKDDVAHELAELHLSKDKYIDWSGLSPGAHVRIQYAWWEQKDPELSVYLPVQRWLLFYSPWKQAPTGGIGPQSDDWMKLGNAMFSPPDGKGGSRTTAAGDKAVPCTTELVVPEWAPSPDSEFKRYIVQKFLEELAQRVELPKPWLDVYIVDFNIQDSGLGALVRMAAAKGGAPKAIWVFAGLNRRMIPHPVTPSTSRVLSVENVRNQLSHLIKVYP